MSAAPTSQALRQILEAHLSSLAPELERWCEEEISGAGRAARRALAEQLNQAVRRLRQAADFDELSTTLADAARPFCNGVAVFSVSENIVRGEQIRGLGDAAEGIRTLEFSAAEAAAFAGVLEEREPVVALATTAQISAGVAQLFGHTPEERVHLIPVLVAGEARAVLYAAGVSEPACLELLAQVAGGALGISPPKPPGGAVHELVQILPPAKPDWVQLTPAEQQMHLKAQRFARVAVSEMRLYRAADVKTGRLRRDLYSALKDSIDRARDAYRERFVQTCPGLPDYLHQELVRTLAQDDATRLGAQYPGPLV